MKGLFWVLFLLVLGFIFYLTYLLMQKVLTSLAEWGEGQAEIPRSVKRCYFRVLLSSAGIFFYLAAALSGFSHYDMYTLLRICVFVYCARMIYTVHYWDSSVKYVYVVMAIVFNPFFPIHFSRGFWSVIDLGAAVVIAGLAYYVLRGIGREARFIRRQNRMNP